MSEFWGAETKPVEDSGFWGADAKPIEKVSVSFSPSTATDEELRHAAIGGNRPSIEEFHRRNLLESNPTLGQAAEEFINKASSALARSPVDIAKSLPSIIKTAAGAIIGFGDPMHPLAQEARQNIRSMIEQAGTDIGTVSKATPGAPLSQFGAAGEAVGRNVGMVAAPALARPALGAAIKGVPAVAERASSRLINSLIKTQPKEFRFGKNPGLEVARQGLTANSREALLEKINAREAKLTNEVQAELARPENAGRVVDITPAVDVVEAGIQEAVRTGQQPLYDRLQAIKDQLTRGFEVDEGKIKAVGEPRYEISPAEAYQLRKDLKAKWTGQAFDDDVNRVKVATYGTLNDIIDQAVPGTKAKNAQVSNLIGASTSLEREINLGRRRNLTGHLLARGPAGVIGGVAGEVAAGGLGIGPGILAGMAAEKLLGSPAVKTRAAAGLAKLAPERVLNTNKIRIGGGMANAKREFAVSSLPKGAYSAFGQEKGFVKEALKQDPLPPESTVKAIKRRSQEYLDDWEDLSLGKKRTVYTRAGEEGPISGRGLELEGGDVHPKDIPGLADLPDSVQQIIDAFSKKYGATYNRIKATAERMAAEDHIANFVLDEATKERIAEAAGMDEHAYRNLIRDEVTAKISVVKEEIPE